MEKLSEKCYPVAGISHADITTARTSPYVLVDKATKIVGSMTTESVVATKTATVELLQATSDAGAGAKALGTAVVKTAPTGDAKLLGMVEAHQSELDQANGFKYVAVKVSSNDTVAVVGSAQLILGGLRYGV